MARSPKLAIEAPALPEAGADVREALANALAPHPMVDEMTRDAHALGAALARDAEAAAALMLAVDSLARALATLAPLEKIKSKAARQVAYERRHQLEMTVGALRLAGEDFDARLAALASDVGDNEIRGLIAECLRGGQLGLEPGAAERVAALLEPSTHSVTVRVALHALYELGAEQAHARWTEILRAGAPTVHVVQVLKAIESQPDQARWAPLVFPLTLASDTPIARAAHRLIQRQGSSFVGYVEWLTRSPGPRDLGAGIESVSKALYWAMLADPELKDVVGPPLLALRARAAEMKVSTAELDRALVKLGVTTDERSAGLVLGPEIASVGTEGGPPLLLPAELAPAWRGVAGPEPFDSGKSDYERACKLRSPPALLSVGAGEGLVLAESACTVHAVPDGFLLHASGDPKEADAERWKKLGVLAVGAAGLLLIDSAFEGGGELGARARIEAAAGRYTILAHRPGGLGTDFGAVQLVREAAR